jgi:hypothetical protein
MIVIANHRDPVEYRFKAVADWAEPQQAISNGGFGVRKRRSSINDAGGEQHGAGKSVSRGASHAPERLARRLQALDLTRPVDRPVVFHLLPKICEQVLTLHAGGCSGEVVAAGN